MPAISPNHYNRRVRPIGYDLRGKFRVPSRGMSPLIKSRTYKKMIAVKLAGDAISLQ